MDHRLHQVQSQKMTLSPQMRQYLKLLQIPLAELEMTIQAELQENPLLEESSGENQDEIQDLPEQSSSEDDPTPEELHVGESFDTFDKIDESYRTNYDDIDYSRSSPSELQKQKDFQVGLITKPEGLADFLLWQINFIDFSDAEKKIANEIIGNINEEGYLKASIEEIAQSLKQPENEVKKVLEQIHELDPPGIGARDLREALLLQLKKISGQDTGVATQIVDDHLPLLQKRDFQQLSKILRVEINMIESAARIISRLDPKPGRTFYVDKPIAVTPDAVVTIDGDNPDKLRIEIHDEFLPRLRINAYYRHLLRQKATDKQTKAFIRDKLQAAFNFMKALSLRKSTLRDITEEIIKVQSEFFKKGFAYLVPLRLKDIAHNLDIHESTVSRALGGKYISTPQGTIPYKSFFSTRLETTTGEAASQKSIMERVRHLIENENPQKPLSDQAILRALNSEGIKVARRTVAKYRDMLKILPSHLRKKKS